MKLIVFSVAFLLISLTSCKSRKASDFKEAIMQKERVAFNITLGKRGPGTQKLEYLIKNDFKGALASVDKQAMEFDKLIKDIESLPADGIKQGNGLKYAAIDYYVALKELHFFDRKEIAQREAIHQLKGDEQQAAQHMLIEFTRQKKTLYEKVYKQEGILHKALEKFNAANRI